MTLKPSLATLIDCLQGLLSREETQRVQVQLAKDSELAKEFQKLSATQLLLKSHDWKQPCPHPERLTQSILDRLESRESAEDRSLPRCILTP
jgi:anti-sigma factor RsiW